MKNVIYILVILLLGEIMCACSDFLEESSQDEVRPGTVNDLEQIMLGEAYPRTEYFTIYLDLLTDDVKSGYPGEDTPALQTTLLTGQYIFTWQEDMFERLKESSYTTSWNTWERYYKYIMGCNVVLDMLDKVVGTEQEKANQRGQALALRSYYYFMLVNLFGQPYNAEGIDVNQTPGVPLILESAVKDEFPSRASVGRVYKQIEDDLLEAAPLMEAYGKNNIKYKVTDLFVHALLSRVYLYMENWDKSIEHATYVINRQPTLHRLANYLGQDDEGVWSISTNVYDLKSTELIWGYSSPTEYQFFSFVSAGVDPPYCVSDELRKLYDYNDSDEDNRLDLRAQYYYDHYVIGLSFFPVLKIVTAPLKGNKSRNIGISNLQKGMRVAEMYLNRAESNIRKYLENGDANLKKSAMEDLNYLRECRYDTRNTTYVDYVVEDDVKLLDFCKDERRRELSFEEHRWFDLRRYGMPELKHTLTLVEGQPQEYILRAKGKRYVLPIPREAIDKTPSLEVNP